MNGLLNMKVCCIRRVLFWGVGDRDLHVTVGSLVESAVRQRRVEEVVMRVNDPRWKHPEELNASVHFR